jgi:hypothetical protein
MAAAATFNSSEYEIKIYQLDQLDELNNKIEFLEKLEGICNRDIKFPLVKNNSFTNKIKEILGDKIIDVINENGKKKINVNLMTIGKDGNLYTYKDSLEGTIVKVEDKYYQKINNKENNWDYIKPKKPFKITDITDITDKKKKETKNNFLKFETLNLKKRFRNVWGKNIKNTFVSILCKKKKKNEILAFIIFSNNNGNIFIEDACGKNRNGEFLLNNMFDYFKKNNFETIKLTALPLVYNIWKYKYNFKYKDEENNSSQIDDKKITAFIENNKKYFYKSSLNCNVAESNTFKEPIIIEQKKKKINFSEIYSNYGIPMELNLNTLKNLDSNLKIPVKIPDSQEKYFKTTGKYSNSKITKFLNSKAAAPSSVSPVSLAPSPSNSPSASTSKMPSVSPAVLPSASPAPPSAPPSAKSQASTAPSSSVSLALSPAPSQASPSASPSAPPASVVLEPRPKMEKDELTAIVSKLEANGILINYGNILKYRDVNLRTSEINNICLWNCQRQTRSEDSKNNGGQKLYTKCEFKNRHLILDTDFYQQVCNGENNNYKYILEHSEENFTLCHNHIKQFLGVKMIFSGKKTGNEVQIKNLLERPSDSPDSVICYYKNPLFINGTFHKDLGNFIEKSKNRSLKNCYFERENDKDGNELSHFKVKALRNIQKGEILYF